MAHDVFISHSSRDKAAADAVCAALEAARVSCWIAPRDVIAGTSYSGQITRAIKASKVMVLIFSEHANVSTAVLSEVELAANAHVDILNFRVDASPLGDDLLFYLQHRHWLDALTPPMEAHHAHLVRSVRTLLGAGQDPVPGSPPGPSAAGSLRRQLSPLTKRLLLPALLGIVGAGAVFFWQHFRPASPGPAAASAPPFSIAPSPSVAVAGPPATAPPPAATPAATQMPQSTPLAESRGGEPAANDNLTLHLFRYSNDDKENRTIQKIIELNLLRTFESLGDEQPDFQYLKNIEVVVKPEEPPASVNKLASLSTQTNAVMLMSGDVRSLSTPPVVDTQVYCGDFQPGLKSSLLFLPIPYAASNADLLVEAHSLVTLYALALEARRSHKPPGVEADYLSRAYALAKSLENRGDPEFSKRALTPIRKAIESDLASLTHRKL